MPAVLNNIRRRISRAHGNPIPAFVLGVACLAAFHPAAAQQAVDESRYQLASGDQIRIVVYNEDDLSRETTVDARGMISYPFLGEINVAGLTPGELEEHIAGGLEGDYLVNPKVSVDILQYRLYFVNGEVGSPGGFPFQPGITVRKAISVAGGFKERASRDKIYVIREGNDGKALRVRLDERVRPGDIITVEQSFF